MAHQCVKCGTLYEDGDSSILTGCKKCGSRFFFFIRNEKLEELKKIHQNLTEAEKEEIEKDIKDLLGLKEEEPVVLDFESILVEKPGKYKIDLVKILKNEALVYKLEEGKYYIDIPQTIRNLEKEKRKK
ncbi:MAG: Zn-ribbon containing protein [Candidatus Woesearchaeota archaeon]